MTRVFNFGGWVFHVLIMIEVFVNDGLLTNMCRGWIYEDLVSINGFVYRDSFVKGFEV